MRRYIDADKLQERLQEEFDKEGAKADEMAMLGCSDASVKYNHGQFCYLNAKELVKDASTADVVEVRHGEWEKLSAHSDICCSLCKRPPKIVFGVAPLYCPNCGAKMDGERSENGKGTDNKHS